MKNEEGKLFGKVMKTLKAPIKQLFKDYDNSVKKVAGLNPDPKKVRNILRNPGKYFDIW